MLGRSPHDRAEKEKNNSVKHEQLQYVGSRQDYKLARLKYNCGIEEQSSIDGNATTMATIAVTEKNQNIECSVRINVWICPVPKIYMTTPSCFQAFYLSLGQYRICEGSPPDPAGGGGGVVDRT